MSLTDALIIGILPAFLVVFATVISNYAGPRENAFRRRLLFMEIITLAILVVLFVLQLIPDLQPFWLGAFFFPMTAGLVILILIELPKLAQLEKKDRIIVILLGLAILAILAYDLHDPSTLFQLLPAAALTLGAAWLIGKNPSRWIWILPAPVIVLGVLWNTQVTNRMTDLPPLVTTILAISISLFPALAVVSGGLLFFTGFRLVFPLANGPVGVRLRHPRIEGVCRLAAAILLLGCLFYAAVWNSIWDQTSDGMGGLFLVLVAIPVAVICGMVMTLRASGWRRLAGIGFAISFSLLTIAGFNWGWQISFAQLTEDRAAQIAQALAQYHQREGVYPKDLDALFPRDLIYIPPPVMFRGEPWCYQSTLDGYHLAAFHHVYFGTPVTLKVYASAGSADGTALPCQERLADMQARFDWSHVEPVRVNDGNPLPTPLPTPVGQTVPAGKTLPLVFTDNASLLPGSWSSDSRWWFFRTPLADGKTVHLDFYDAAAGQVCGEQTFPYEPYDDGSQSAWVSGDRLLYIDGNGVATILAPCSSRINFLDPPAGVTLLRVSASQPVSGQVLLQSEKAFWLLQPGKDQIQPVLGVTPNPNEGQSDRAAWAPDGSRIAIARLNSRQPKDGSTIYVVDGTSGKVISSLVVDQASEQTAPFVEWLTVDQLLLNGSGKLLMIDMRANPPKTVDVMSEFFKLDIAFPDQIHSMSSVTSRDGSSFHLMVWANHPRNQNIYVYHSENGQIDVLTGASQATLLFPDGQWTALTKIGDPDPSGDLLYLYRIDTGSTTPVQIRINGHYPRGYPMLGVHYLSKNSRLLVDSSNGVSLVSVPAGNLIDFWKGGSGAQTNPNLILSPDEASVLFLVDGEGIFKITLPD